MFTFDGIVVLTVLYRCEACGVDEKIQKMFNVLEVKCLRTVHDMGRIFLGRNDRIRKRCSNEKELKTV